MDAVFFFMSRCSLVFLSFFFYPFLANNWLNLDKRGGVDALTFNDIRNGYTSTKYLCSNNFPYYSLEQGDSPRNLAYAGTVSAANSENPLMVQDSGSKPFQVEVIPCNSFGCSTSFSMGETLFPAAPDLVVIRVTGPSQLSLQLVAPPSIASASELSFVVAGMLPCITVYIGFTISFSALLQRPVPSLCCFGGFFANSCFLFCAQSKIKCGWIMFQYLLSGSPSISTMETSTYLDPVQPFRVTKLELGEAQMPATTGRINAMPMTK